MFSCMIGCRSARLRIRRDRACLCVQGERGVSGGREGSLDDAAPLALSANEMRSQLYLYFGAGDGPGGVCSRLIARGAPALGVPAWEEYVSS